LTLPRGRHFAVTSRDKILSWHAHPRQLLIQPLPAPNGLSDARLQGMTRIAYNVSGKSNVFNTALVPGNHSEEARFGLIDGAVIVFFLLCIGGFICFLVV
jgi:hypothetical protein